MRNTMLIWAALMVVGILLIAFFRVPAPVDEGVGAWPLVPVGYFLVLIGGAGMVVAWIRKRSK